MAGASNDERTLTVDEANRLAPEGVRVRQSRDDPGLWLVNGPGWLEVHEPMRRLAWDTFLAEKVDADAGPDEPGGYDLYALGPGAEGADIRGVNLGEAATLDGCAELLKRAALDPGEVAVAIDVATGAVAACWVKAHGGELRRGSVVTAE